MSASFFCCGAWLEGRFEVAGLGLFAVDRDGSLTLDSPAEPPQPVAAIVIDATADITMVRTTRLIIFLPSSPAPCLPVSLMASAPRLSATPTGTANAIMCIPPDTSRSETTRRLPECARDRPYHSAPGHSDWGTRLARQNIGLRRRLVFALQSDPPRHQRLWSDKRLVSRLLFSQAARAPSHFRGRSFPPPFGPAPRPRKTCHQVSALIPF